MAPRILITGGTGYIGGSVLETIVKQHPEYEVAALLRSTPPGFGERYPNVKVIHGDYDSGTVLSNAAHEADIVIHNGNSDHEASARALISGLTQKSGPCHLIHLSGSAIIADWQQESHLGLPNSRVWNDVADIDTLVAGLPDAAIHRNVDKIILAAGPETGGKVRTAIVCPSDIYGAGLGPGTKRSIWFPIFLKESRRLGHTFFAREGRNVKGWTHIEDLVGLYLHLVEAAVKGGEGADWGEKGYYFASTQEVVHRDVAVAVGRILHAKGLVAQLEPKEVPIADLATMTGDRPLPIGRYFWGANTRIEAQRARERFGWGPRAEGLFEAIEKEVEASL